VAAATEEHIRAATASDGYGYQWWVDDRGYVMALGYAGQYVIVDRQLDLVTVITSGLRGADFDAPESLYQRHVVPAAVSDEPLPPNPEAMTRLAELVTEAADPTPAEVPPAPETAAAVSGRIYDFEPNDIELEWLSLTFDEDTAAMAVGQSGIEFEVQIGLDGIHRILELPGFPNWGWTGRWFDDDTFAAVYELAGEASHGQMLLDFEGDQLVVRVIEFTDGESYRVTGQARD
jgi:hypothetical protein